MLQWNKQPNFDQFKANLEAFKTSKFFIEVSASHRFPALLELAVHTFCQPTASIGSCEDRRESWVDICENSKLIIYFYQFNSQVLEFWPQNFIWQSDCFVQPFSIMIDSNWINFGHLWVLGFFAGIP